MKGKKKKVLGLLGLFLVAAITAFAVFLPQQGASAAEQSVTDTVTVRVISNKPLIDITEPSSGDKVTKPKVNLEFDYEDVESYTVEVEYTDENGDVHYFEACKASVSRAPGSASCELDLDQYGGFGKYKVTVKGTSFGVEGAAQDVVEFFYNNVVDPDVKPEGGNNEPVTPGPGEPGSGPSNPFVGNLVVDPGVDPEDDRVDHVEICVRYENGDPVEGMCPLTSEAPFGPVELPFEDEGLPSGWYSVDVQAYDQNGNELGDKETLWFYYEATEIPTPSTGAPNTGGMFGSLNISREDYLITGLIVFIAAALLGVVLIVRRKKATAKRSKR